MIHHVQYARLVSPTGSRSVGQLELAIRVRLSCCKRARLSSVCLHCSHSLTFVSPTLVCSRATPGSSSSCASSRVSDLRGRLVRPLSQPRLRKGGLEHVPDTPNSYHRGSRCESRHWRLPHTSETHRSLAHSVACLPCTYALSPLQAQPTRVFFAPHALLRAAGGGLSCSIGVT